MPIFASLLFGNDQNDQPITYAIKIVCDKLKVEYKTPPSLESG